MGKSSKQPQPYVAHTARRRLLKEAEGTFALGEPENVMEYVYRLLDLPNQRIDLTPLKEAYSDMLRAEAEMRKKRKAWRDQAETIFRLAMMFWTPKQVEVALFGHR